MDLYEITFPPNAQHKPKTKRSSYVAQPMPLKTNAHNSLANKSSQERLDKWLNSRSESMRWPLGTPENGIQHERLSVEFASKDVE